MSISEELPPKPPSVSSTAQAAEAALAKTQQSANYSDYTSYNDYLKAEFGRMADRLPLSDLQRDFLRLRWLDQVLWMEDRAGKSRNWYYRLRMTTIIGGVLMPILVGLNTGENLSKEMAAALRYTTIGLGAVVAASSAIEEFFHYGERWRHYRRSAESLKTQGWQFFHLTGPYAIYSKAAVDDYEGAFTLFASQVEEVIQRDVEVYSTQLSRDQKQGTAKEVKQEEA
jgi:Protein of unknown function (DUF4231)